MSLVICGTFIISACAWVRACLMERGGGIKRQLNENILMNLPNKRCGKVGADLESGFYLPTPCPALACTLLRHDGGRT